MAELCKISCNVVCDRTNPGGCKIANVREELSRVEYPYRQAIIDRMDAQTRKGLQKYGVRLDMNPLDMQERIEHLAQELTDGLMYIEHIKSRLAQTGADKGDVVAYLAAEALKYPTQKRQVLQMAAAILLTGLAGE